MKLILCSLCVIVLLPWGNSFAQETVATPKLPELPQQENALTKKIAQKVEKSPEEENIPVTITFLKPKTTFQGEISIQPITLNVKTQSKGFSFKKSIPLRQIKKIRILTWSHSTKKNKSGYYYFLPQEYEIETITGTKLIYKGNIQIFNRLLFKSEIGESFFFSYFLDKYENGKFKNLGLENEFPIIKEPIEKVFYEIQFKTLKKEDK